MADERVVPELVFAVEGGTLVMQVLDSRQVIAPHSARLEKAMQTLALTRDVALLAITSHDLRAVDAAVAPTWIKRIKDPAFRLRTIAVVTSRSAVRVVAGGVAQAAKLLGSPLELKIFSTEIEARLWLRERGQLN